MSRASFLVDDVRIMTTITGPTLTAYYQTGLVYYRRVDQNEDTFATTYSSVTLIITASVSNSLEKMMRARRLSPNLIQLRTFVPAIRY